MRERQVALLELVADDDRPLVEWSTSMLTLAPRVYPADAALAAEFDTAIRRLASIDFACIGTDDPSAPPPGAPARDALTYLFRDAATARSSAVSSRAWIRSSAAPRCSRRRIAFEQECPSVPPFTHLFV